MAYIQGMGQAQQAPTTQGPDVSKGAPGIPGVGPQLTGGATAPSTTFGQNAPMQSAPSSVLGNINAYNNAGAGSFQGASNLSQGLQNYSNYSQQYNPGGQGSWTPWALQDKSLGGGGYDNATAGNLFLGGPEKSFAGDYGFKLNSGAANQNGTLINAFTKYQNSYNPYSGQNAGQTDLGGGNINNIYSQAPYGGSYWGGGWKQNPAPGNNQSIAGRSSQDVANQVAASRSYDKSYYDSTFQKGAQSLYNMYNMHNPGFSDSISFDDFAKYLYQTSNPGDAPGQAKRDYYNYGQQTGYLNK